MVGITVGSRGTIDKHKGYNSGLWFSESSVRRPVALVWPWCAEVLHFGLVVGSSGLTCEGFRFLAIKNDKRIARG